MRPQVKPQILNCKDYIRIASLLHCTTTSGSPQVVCQIDIYLTWLPSLGIKPCSFPTSSIILPLGHQKNLMLLFDVSITLHYTTRNRFCNINSCHWLFVSPNVFYQYYIPNLEISYIPFLLSSEALKEFVLPTGPKFPTNMLHLSLSSIRG